MLGQGILVGSQPTGATAAFAIVNMTHLEEAEGPLAEEGALLRSRNDAVGVSKV